MCELAGPARHRSRDDAGTVHTRSVRRRDGGGRRGLHRALRHRGRHRGSRDASLPLADQIDAQCSPTLHAWQPLGGGAAGALSHAVIHSLDVTVALDRAAVAPKDAVVAILDQLTAANGAHVGLELTGVRLEATDTESVAVVLAARLPAVARLHPVQ